MFCEAYKYIRATIIGLVYLMAIFCVSVIFDSSVWAGNIFSYFYQSNLFTCTYYYDYKVEHPSGVHGFAPRLSLSYNSFLVGNTNNQLGTGWEIPSNHIQKNSNDTYSLILNGARHDLVDAGNGRYRTRIESYLKIEKKPCAANSSGEAWEVTAKDGTRYSFGITQDADNILYPGIPETPQGWRWSLDRITDTNGNAIYYSYVEDQGVVYPGRIEYNNDRQRVIEFTWEDRPDPVSLVDEGSAVTIAKRLSRIDVSVSGSLVKSIRLAYSPITPETPLSLLSSITKYGSDGVTSLPPTRFTYTQADAQTRLLETITSDLGGVTTIAYAPSSTCPNSSLPSNYWVVSSVTRDNGLPAGNSQRTIVTTGYACANGLFDVPSNEFRGFGMVTETHRDGTNIISQVIHTFNQDDALKGTEAQTLTTDAAGKPYIKTVNSWSATTADGVHNVTLDRVETFTYDGVAASPKQVVKDYQFDQFGNVTLEADYGDAAVSGDELFTFREYAQNENLWLLNRVKRLYSAATPGGAHLRESWFQYDGGDLNAVPVQGNLTREEHFLDSGENPVTTYRYDSYGNRIETIDPEGRATKVEYDADYHAFPVRVTNAKGQVTERQFDPAIGKPVLERDPNGAETVYVYDNFKRLMKVVKPGDTLAFPTTEINYNLDGSAPENVTVKAREQAGTANTLDTIQSVDGLGRVIQTRAEYQNPASQIVVDTFHDAMGRESGRSLPYLATASVGYSAPLATPKTVTEYDPIGRPLKVTNPDGTFSLRSYNHWSVTETNENSHLKQKWFDADGKLAQVAEVNGSETYLTRYGYNPLGELLTTTNHLGNTTTHSYDSLGRKTKVVDPDLGTRTSRYDRVGNIIATTDAKGIATRFTFDPLNRVTKVDYPNDPDISYVYDEGKVGALSRVTDALGTVAYTYDARLRKTGETRTMDGMTWTTSWAYDPMDRLTSQTYPDGQVTTFSYNGMGKLSAISGILSAIDYNQAGSETRRGYINGLATQFNYYPENFHLKRILTTNIQNFSYEYDYVGNVKKIVNATQPASPRTENFTYDPLNRLLMAEDAGAGGYRKDYLYNPIGNMLTETSVQNGTTSMAQYTYGEAGAGPHAVTGKTDQKPIVALFSLNNGQPYTTTRQVTLSNVTIGNPSEFLASESPEFAGASWQPYGTAISYTLTGDPGKKTVYFKVRRNGIESTYKIAEIEYLSADVDSDGIPDAYDNDSNNDGFPDAWANRYALVGTIDSQADPDGDSWNNQREYQQGTDPTKADNPQMDSSSDNYVLKRASFSQTGAAQLSDSYILRDSLQQVGFNQGGGQRESENYALNDALGRQTGYLGLADSDGDGIADIVDDDDDNDGMPDVWEAANGLNPHDRADAQADPDGDGMVNLQEYLKGTKPILADSDSDGLSDYLEVYVFHTTANGSDPFISADSDGDGLPDASDTDPAHYNVIAISEGYTLRHGNFSAGSAQRSSETYSTRDRLGNGEAGVSLSVNSGAHLKPIALDFGTYTGSVKTMRLTVTNAGSESIDLGSLTTTGINPYEFTVVANGCSGKSMAAASTCTVDVQFVPSYSGAKSAQVEIPTSDSNTPLLSAQLTGVAAGMSDSQSPIGSVVVDDGRTFTRSTTVSLKLTAKDASGASEMCVSNDNVCSRWEPYIGTKEWVIPAGDGPKTVHAWYRDKLGNATTAPLNATITLDTVSPTVNLSLRSGIYNSGQTVTLTTSEPATIYYTLNGTNPTTASSVYSKPILVSGNAILKLVAIDLAGNASSVQTEQFVVDTTGPSLSVTAPVAGSWTSLSTVELTGKTTDGTRVSRLTINGVSVPLAYDGSFSQSLTLLPGLNQINTAAVDEAGNQTIDSRVVGLDQQAPSIAISLPVSGETVCGPSYIIKGTAGDGNGSGIQRVEVSTDGGQSWRVASGTTNWSFDWQLPEPGAVSIKARATDAAGNTGNATGANITVRAGYRLDITINGTGKGAITGPSVGISCNSTCGGFYESGSTITLTAEPDYSLFTGWSGACSGTGNCIISLQSNTTVTATFTKDDTHVVRLDSPSPLYYSTIQAAYNAAPSNSTIQIWGINLTEACVLNRNISVMLKGGYDDQYSGNAGVTTINL